jgi:predicted acylesterase/phospholipase RssA
MTTDQHIETAHSQKNPVTSPDKIEIPREGEAEVYALSFGPGAFDTMVQLGVIHALLVAHRRPPNVVLGLSAGAINAVALGEVFAEPGGIHGQISRFREILNAARNSLRVLRHELSPDPLELNTTHALSPMTLPIHHGEEREKRTEALRSVTGILRLFNDVTKLRVTLHVLVQLAQRYLTIVQAKVYRDPSRYRSAVWRAYGRMAGFVLLYQWRFVIPFFRTIRRVIQSDQSSQKSKPLNHFLWVWKRARALGIAKALQILGALAAPGTLLVLLWEHRHESFLDFVVIGGFVVFAMYCCPALGVIAWGLKDYCRGPIRSANSPSEEPRQSSWFSRFIDRLLASYDLKDQLFHDYVLKQFLISTFDPNYYGKFDHPEATNTAIREADEAMTHSEESKSSPLTFEKYLNPTCPRNGHETASPQENSTNDWSVQFDPVRVIVVGTALKDGQSIGFPVTTNIIDAMMASMAFTPFLKAQEITGTGDTRIDGNLYIDPACIGEEPIAPLMYYLHDYMHPSSSAAHVFHVVPFPATQPKEESDAFTSITAIADRSLELLHSHHVTIEQDLTKQYSALLPNTAAIHRIPLHNGLERKFVSANLFPIETEQPLHITRQFLAAPSNEERERIVLEAVATGCRITLQRLLSPESSDLQLPKDNTAPVSCRKVLEDLGLTREEFPGSSQESGPGLNEVCKHCEFEFSPTEANPPTSPTKYTQSLKPIGLMPNQPIWPTRLNYHNRSVEPKAKPSQTSLEQTESSRPQGSAKDLPWISTVWSGGVFRGVFQIGAIAAYNEVGIKPRVFAGASVGSIMAAMAARVTSLDKAAGRFAIQKAAATFIGLDRLVITDRFADLVRRLTIRANDVHVTPQMLDDVCRQFERLNSANFHRTVREVAAGFERLFYISPFELYELVQALHNTDNDGLKHRITGSIDYFFERSGAGLEMLGAEPLKMLIAEHVLEGIPDAQQRTISIDGFLTSLRSTHNDDLPYLLISTTDLTRGKPHMIGEDSLMKRDDDSGSPLLVEALLAGSAFPAVFRPRRFSEVYPTGKSASVFVDGGIMDNLPLSPVIGFLREAAERNKLKLRPHTPHLILSASLERRVRNLTSDEQAPLKNDWRKLKQRVTELRYNRKVTSFTNAQRHFQTIYDAFPNQGEEMPLNLVVGATTPAWLCGTFGFHPMLGFTQIKQAGSIAHGCAMTLATLDQLHQSHGKNEWGISMGEVNKDAFKHEPPLNPIGDDPVNANEPGDRVVNPDYLATLPEDIRREKRASGMCWYRNEVCPFSEQGIESGAFLPETREALTMIHRLCGEPSTHSS